MLFTRAAMSSARCIKLVHMMGLHLLDSDGDVELPPTILPPQNWTELEERRRVFWGAFAIDSHASISTGWPTLIDVKDVTTHLPSFELAFNTEKEEKTCTLTEALTSSSYSSFSGSIIMCYILNQILRHVHRPKADDRPEDVEYGAFWKRHRDLDNMLAGVFMFLPENFRLPRNVRDPVAVHTNMNLHAAVICLHNAAIDRADQYKLPTNIRKISLDRCHTAAAEIVGIVKLTSHQINMGYKSPLIALALYCAASVYIYQAKEDPGAMPASNLDNLEFVLRAMEAIGRDHMVTRSFLQQVVIDIEHNGILTNFKLPKIDKVVMEAKMLAPCAHNIPILARAAISRHTKVQSPLPGRLPLGNGRGTVDGCVSAGGVVCSPEHMGNWTVNVQAVLRAQITAAAARAAAAAGASQQSGGDSRVNDDDSSANSGNSHKRKRHSPPDNSTTAASGTPSLNSSSQTGQQQPSFSRMGIGISNMHGKQAAVTAARNPVVRLPDRTGSPSPRPSPVGISPTTSTSAATPSSSTSSNPGRPNVHRRPSARGAVTVMGFVGTSAMATDLGSREPRQQQHQHLSSNQLGRDKAAVFEAIMADLGMGTTSPLSFKDYVSYSPRLDADVDGATAGGVGREKQYPVRDDDDEADGGDDDGDTSSDQFLGLRRSSGPGPSLGAGDVVWCNTSANDARAVIVDLESIMLDGGQTASSTTTYTGSTSATNADDDSPGVAGWEIGGAGPGHR